ncbi:MAG: MotA/TolQ/ExbB proton channel family protein [Bdellovibrionaceae bacterium]|nr:MotA/TolQ/ExbB proton channel family protein [Pseudobdellovibrionaceae bacterium]
MGTLQSVDAISQAFSAGGIWMWAILMAQIASIAIIIERVIHLYLFRSPVQRKIVQRFEKDIKSGNLKNALSAHSKTGRNPIFNVVKAGAQAADSLGGREEVQAKMDEVLVHEAEKLDKRTGYLPMLGNVGTLLGLLGTIVGLIQAFSSVATNTNPVEKAAVLTQGISMAMNTTAYGLIMAIPALVAYAILQSRTRALNEDLKQAAQRVANWLSFNFSAITKTTKKKSS